MMISTTIPSTALGWFITAFIVFSLDVIFCRSTTYVEEGAGSRLSCKHDVPDNEFRRVRWFKSIRDDVYENGDPAVVSWDGSSPPYTTGNYDIDKNFSLVINNTSIREEGIYRCYVTRNIPGDLVYYEMKIIVYGKVKPTHASPEQYHEYGTHLRIPCSYNSTRASTVAALWYKRESYNYFRSDDQPIASWTDGGKHVSADYTLTDDFSLEIQKVSFEHKAVYRCLAVFTGGSRPSASDTNVTVYGEVKPPHLRPVKNGTRLKIPCSYNSTRASTVAVLWYKKNSTGILSSDDQPIASSIDGRRHVLEEYNLTDDFSLEIQNVSSEYEAVYRSIVVSTQETRPSANDTDVTVFGEVKPFQPSPVQYGTHLRIPCSYDSPRASGLVSVLWYKRESRDCFKNDDQPIASSIDGNRHVLEDYTLTDDFSLEIQNVSNEYEAVYRSIVVSTQETRPSASDTYVTVFALPREVPLIRHSFQNDSSIINCSVDHVYPLLFPKLNFLSNNQTYGIQNEDGTFNTSVSLNVIHSGHSITLECSFPYFNYNGKSSLLIPANITDEDEGLLPTDCSASACPTHVASTIGIAFGVVLLGIGLITVAVVVRKMHTKQHQQKDEKTSTPEMERMV